MVHILGQQAYLAGSQAAVRVITTDSKNEVLSGGNLKIELIESEKHSRLLFKGSLDRRGTTEAQFRLPAGIVGTLMAVKARNEKAVNIFIPGQALLAVAALLEMPVHLLGQRLPIESKP